MEDVVSHLTFSVTTGPAPEDAKALRLKVFIDEQHFPASVEFDEFDAVSTHISCYHNNQLCGYARVYNSGPDKSIFHVGRICVPKEFRKYGIGKIVMEKADEIIVNNGGIASELSSQYQVQNFYEKCGYSPEGEQYLEEGWPHIKMVKHYSIKEKP